MENLSMFFRFNKKLWVPILIFTVMFILWPIISPAMPVILQFGIQIFSMIMYLFLWVFVFFGIMASRVRLIKFKPGDLDLTWGDYRGNPEVVEKGKRWVEYLQGSAEFEAMGGEHEPGILLIGKPGVGKTYWAKVLASMAGVPVWVLDGQSLLGTFIGIGPLKVATIFRNARNEAIKNKKGMILFIDEIDAIGGSRGGGAAGGMFGEVVSAGMEMVHTMPMPMGMGGGGQILNSLLQELDGIHEKRSMWWRIRRSFARWIVGPNAKNSRIWPRLESPKLMVIGSTNRPEFLDEALVRRGRLGTRLAVDVPTIDGLIDVAQYYLYDKPKAAGTRGISVEKELTPDFIAKVGAGRTPADVRYILNSSVQVAHKKGHTKVSVEDFMVAFAEGVVGDRNPLPLDDKQKRMVAYHEAGHAVVLLSMAGDRLRPVILTVERFGRALGHMYPAETYAYYIGETEKMLEARACISMGGMASEEVFLNERHASGGGDIPNILSTLKSMAFQGMLGRWPLEMTSYVRSGRMSDAMESMIGRKWDILWDETKNILLDNKEAVEILVALLMEKGTLTELDINEAMEGKINVQA